MENSIGVNFKDIIEYGVPEEIFEDEIIVFDIKDFDVLKRHIDTPPIRIHAFAVFMVINGSMSISIDYTTYRLGKNMILELSARHVVENVHLSSDFRGYVLLVAPDMMSRIMRELEGIKPMYTQPFRLQPVQQLSNDQMGLLERILVRIRRYMKADSHIFQRYLAKNMVSTFILELINIVVGKAESDNLLQEVNHREEVVIKFIKLLMENCKDQHEVSFYSTQLFMTPENLSRIMKTFSGKTVNKWIADALIGEAKILLRKPDINVQQVAEELNFSDQSSFGKFFKKHTGKTPMEYKNRIIPAEKPL